MDSDFIVFAQDGYTDHQVAHNSLLLIEWIHESEPASVDLVVALEVNIGPIEFETSYEGVIEDELLLVEDFEADG